jgi:hypothetical protein
VHDWLAHAGEGHSFGPTGEENAYRVHASTLSPQAQRALATETRGQNSWVNFGPNAHLPAKERPFAEQKAALWPEGLLGDYSDMSARTPVEPLSNRSLDSHAAALRAAGLFDEANDLLNFGKDSKVRDLQFHGTNADFDTFAKGDGGFHVGPPSAASRRGDRVMPLAVNIRNPLRVPDEGDFASPFFLGELERLGAITGDEYRRLEPRLDRFWRGAKGTVDPYAATAELRELLKQKGYDGYVYRNRFEGGGDSFMAFDAAQLRNPFARSPKNTAGAPAVVTPPSQQDVFDVSKLGLDVPAGVTTERPPVRYPQRADMSAFDAVIGKFKSHYTPNVERAITESPDAAGWYDMTQLRDAMDPKDFEQFMLFMGPTSSGTKVPENIRQASQMFQLWKNDPAKFADDLRAGTLELPKGYANRRQSSINSGLLRILETGNLDPFDTPKTYRYANQLAGRSWGGAALDMHVGRQVGRKGMRMTPTGELTPDTGFPISTEKYRDQKLVSGSPQSAAHYAHIEDALVKEANRMGLAPAQYQALGWVGGGAKTNVSDTRPLLGLLNEKLRTTAEKFGTGTPMKALELFRKGEIPLWALGGMTAGGLLTSREGGEQY